MFRAMVLAGVTTAFSLAAAAVESPVQQGVASKYLLDQGIKGDPDVILFEDYEIRDLDGLKRNGWGWSSGSKGTVYEIATDPKLAFQGRGCLKKSIAEGKKGAIMPVDLNPRESAAVYHRVYTKIPADAPAFRIMGITGVNKGMPTWKAIGSAGMRPTGANYYCVTLTMYPKGGGIRPMWYPYHMDQKGPYGDNWWVDRNIPTDRWFCLEMMTKLNTPGRADGELGLWYDGVQVYSKTDMRYRSVDSLKTAMIFDQCYSSKSFKGSSAVYADNRVVARKYIGPMRKPGEAKAAGGVSAAAPAHNGIAARYVRDRGIKSDPDVLMVEGFESPGWAKKWQENAKAECKTLETDPKIVQNGKSSLKVLFKPENGMGGAGWLHHWWDGSEVAYLRYYVRLSKGGNWSNQKLFQLHGHPRGQRYGRGAGKRPTGYDSFSAGTGVGSVGWKNTGPPWKKIILYSYFPGQKGGYGDNVQPNKGIKPEIDEERWYCYEVMIKLNQIGKSDGEQRLWIDGKLIIEQEGMLWRKGENMVINDVMLATYTHKPPEAGKTRCFWLDSVVLARKRIGPMVTEPPKPAAGTSGSVPIKPVLTGEEARKSAAEKEAGRLYQMARQAERMGQRDVARRLYSQIVEKHPGTAAAEKARKKLR